MYYLLRGSFARKKLRARELIRFWRTSSVRTEDRTGSLHGAVRRGNSRRKQRPNYGRRKEAKPREKESLTRVKATTKKSCHFFGPRRRVAIGPQLDRIKKKPGRESHTFVSTKTSSKIVYLTTDCPAGPPLPPPPGGKIRFEAEHLRLLYRRRASRKCVSVLSDHKGSWRSREITCPFRDNY